MFNSQAEILPNHNFYQKPWAMLADWRKWQAEKVKAQHPALHCALFTEIDAAKDWLYRQGFDIDFTQIDFRPCWLEPSEEFTQLLQTLGVDKRRFRHEVN